MNDRFVPLALALGIALLSGCGGAGSSENGVDRGASATGERTASGTKAPAAEVPAARAEGPKVGVWLTAHAEKLSAWEHAFVLIQRVEAVGADEKTRVLFDDPEGVLVDLVALIDGKALPLAVVDAPTGGPVARIRLVLGPSMQLFARGHTESATTAIAETFPRDASGRPVAMVTLGQPRDLSSGKEELVLAADLGALAVRDGKVSPGWGEGKSDSLNDAARRLTRDLSGAIQEIAGEAPTQSFTLRLASGSALVQAGAGTALFQAAGASNPTLSDGTPAVVRATLDPSTRRWSARQIALGKPEATAVQGQPSGIDRSAGTFTLKAVRIEGTLPLQTVLTVTVAENASLRSRGGLALTAEAFWAALAQPNASVEVEGVYEPVTGALLARRAKIGGDVTGGAHEVMLTAAASETDPQGGTLTLSAPSAWDGFAAPAKAIGVTTVPATTFRDEKGEPLDAAGFFGAAKDRQVRAIGLLSGDGKFTATRIELRPATPKPAVVATPEPEKEKKDEKAEEKARPAADPKGA